MKKIIKVVKRVLSDRDRDHAKKIAEYNRRNSKGCNC